MIDIYGAVTGMRSDRGGKEVLGENLPQCHKPRRPQWEVGD
jgi:hypothetical protein